MASAPHGPPDCLFHNCDVRHKSLQLEPWSAARLRYHASAARWCSLSEQILIVAALIAFAQLLLTQAHSFFLVLHCSVSVHALQQGDIVVSHPCERIPCDGQLVAHPDFSLCSFSPIPDLIGVSFLVCWVQCTTERTRLTAHSIQCHARHRAREWCAQHAVNHRAELCCL